MKHNYEACSSSCKLCKNHIKDLEQRLKASDYTALQEMGIPESTIKMFFGPITLTEEEIEEVKKHEDQ